MPEHPDRCSYDRGSADDVRIAFGRQSPGRGGDALPLINLEKRDVRLLPWAALSGTNPNHDRGARAQRLNFFMADVRDGFGPFLGVLLQGKGWSPARL